MEIKIKCLHHLLTFFNSISDTQTFIVSKQKTKRKCVCSADDCLNGGIFVVEKK